MQAVWEAQEQDAADANEDRPEVFAVRGLRASAGKVEMIPEKVRCSINRKWFVDEHGNAADRGAAVFSWCEDHKKPVALLSLEHEQQHDRDEHGRR
jgi:hypothetical protein